MKIITITLSPAFDIHCHIKAFLPYHENLATVLSRDAGGKGINISRALTRNGVENTAVVVLGEENATDFCQCLAQDNIRIKKISVPGRIRENITIHTENAEETRISFSGFSANQDLLKKTEELLNCEIDSNTVVTFTGRVPDGIHLDQAKSFLLRTKDKGAKIVIDSRSFETTDLLDVKPWLIKPNQEEISHYFKREILSLQDALDAAKLLHNEGILNIMVSMGGEGAILVCDQGVWAADAPKINVLSTIGAGDSSIAGFLFATSKNLSKEQCLKTAVAYGSAACIQQGTRPPSPEDIQNLLQEIHVFTL